ncbi:Zn(II)2Cys6 transcription factor [Aspergillus affinis]|uniref:Zn(II)2Cys6 transcription factor n=1 Tax=Aspergillus affinis TaxID=1070780 RepID=UPI0022FDC875|nr:uncharacterized protein KD926_010817 [Aspergillus affinis]KAI9038400.1 hypothetical protein KD926_010817 [Aspergillus affinis]
MNVSPTSPESHPHRIERRRSVGESSVGAWSTRPKPVATACERCRRRKIRCDGETPCATCRRFSIACVRPRKNSETQAALEQRVRQLEAQIVELSTGFVSTSQTQIPGVQGVDYPSPARKAPPVPLTLNTQFGDGRQDPEDIACDEPFKHAVGDFDSPGLDIPRIEIVDCAGLSPTSLTPTPSLPSAGSVASSPMSGTLDAGLIAPHFGLALSPPMSTSPSPSYDSLPYLSPTSVAESSISRRSSVSSLGLDMDWGGPNITIPDSPDDDLSFNSFAPLPSDVRPTPVPTRFEAETLLDLFFEKAHAFGYPVDQSRFRAFLDIIDGSYDRPLGPGHPQPVSMARFHVYMAMAIGLRLKTDGRATGSRLLENCYRLALDQIRSPQFWSQPLAGEAAMLMVLFARASQDRTC